MPLLIYSYQCFMILSENRFIDSAYTCLPASNAKTAQNNEDHTLKANILFLISLRLLLPSLTLSLSLSLSLLYRCTRVYLTLRCIQSIQYADRFNKWKRCYLILRTETRLLRWKSYLKWLSLMGRVIQSFCTGLTALPFTDFDKNKECG